MNGATDLLAVEQQAILTRITNLENSVIPPDLSETLASLEVRIAEIERLESEMRGVFRAGKLPSSPGGSGGLIIELPDFSTETTTYLDAFVSEGDFRWAADPAEPAFNRTYYDRSYLWYAFSEAARGDFDQQDYQDTYVYPNNCRLDPRELEPDGLVEHYLRNNDANLLECLRSLAHQQTTFFIDLGWVDGCCWEGRIQERAGLTVMMADAMGAPETDYVWFVEATQVKDGLISTQNPDGSWTPPSVQYTATNPPTGHDGGGQVSTNFMAAVGMSYLLRYAEFYDDDVVNIQATVDLGMQWMWDTQWVPSGSGFQFFSAEANTGGTVLARDLNMLFVDVFGWLFFKTGDTKWITRGDQVFMGALDNMTYNIGIKQFNQFFRNSWRYLYFRDGYDISALNNPTEVHL